ncbi:hypothetical protein BN135_1851 [Cronobacter muytjensii 530]
MQQIKQPGQTLTRESHTGFLSLNGRAIAPANGIRQGLYLKRG